ncbi:MAG: transketolase C-terminal domain-containing protein, partial [bacterium]
VFTIEEGSIIGGFGAGISEFSDKNGFSSARIIKIGITDNFVEHGSREELLELLGLTTSGIAEKIRNTILKGGA